VTRAGCWHGGAETGRRLELAAAKPCSEGPREVIAHPIPQHELQSYQKERNSELLISSNLCLFKLNPEAGIESDSRGTPGSAASTGLEFQPHLYSSTAQPLK
jgi:hypothetical protein